MRKLPGDGPFFFQASRLAEERKASALSVYVSGDHLEMEALRPRAAGQAVMQRPSAHGTLVISIAHLTRGRTMDSRAAVQVRECLPSMPPEQDRPLGTAAAPLANEQGRRVALATRDLLALGHRRILLVSGPDSDASVADACLSGHCQVMLAEQLPLLPRLQLDTADESNGPELLSLLESVAPTALLLYQAQPGRAFADSFAGPS